jgi:DeoR/GlpR family transcriptional regulator of sugar metabolism
MEWCDMMNQRCLTILELLNQEETLDVNDLAQRLNVSSVTVRKDLATLENKGLLHRQHGAAVRVSPNDVGYRMTFDYEVKRRIAKKASELVASGEAVMIESGSTCAMLAEELVRTKRDVTIITNSAFIAGYVRSIPGARVVLLGGSYDPDAQVMSGPLVGKCAEEFYVDKFFIGTDGYDPKQGFSNVDMLRAEAVRAMAARADKRIILTDSSKFNKRGVVQLMPASRVTRVITDDVPDNCRESLEASGVEILLT